MTSYTIKSTDPHSVEVEQRVAGKMRRYQVRTNTGETFQIIENNPDGLPICRARMKMQRRILEQYFQPKPAAKAKPAKPTEE